MQNTLGNSFENESLTLQDTNFTKTNLFFIKSKHVFRQFKNHDYFQNIRNQSFSHKFSKQRQFVEGPTPYGINNAYNYVCTEVSKNLLQKAEKRQARTITDFKTFNQTKLKKINVVQTEPRRKLNSIFPNLNNLQQKKCQFIQDTLSQDSFKDQTKKEKATSKTQELLPFLFISKSNSAQKWKATQININIYPHIVNTFLKSRINYFQMTQNQFSALKSFIVGIFQTQREYVQYKDMVNIKSIKEIFNILQSQNYSQTYKKEMVRYFFIANTLTYEYQLNKLKDQLKILVSYKFNKDIKNDEIFIYQANNSTEITNLHQLLKLNGPIIFGLECKILHLYNQQIQEKEAQNKIENRIKRWKSIAPQQNMRFQTHPSLPVDKYQTLFNHVRRKREKFIKNKKKPGTVLKTSQFIDRAKLVKNDDIFQ